MCKVVERVALSEDTLSTLIDNRCSTSSSEETQHGDNAGLVILTCASMLILKGVDGLLRDLFVLLG